MAAVIRKATRGQRWVVWGLTIGILVPASLGFGTKIYEFVRVVLSEGGTEFTLIPLANYFLATLGFVCLMIWAVLHGMFKDVEAPKYTMLEQEERLDAGEQAGRRT